MGRETEQTQRSGDGNGTQQIQSAGNVSGTVVGPGGIHIGDGNSGGISITTVASPGEPRHFFTIAKKTRIPAPISVLGTLSAVVTLLGFATDAYSVKQLLALGRSISEQAASDVLASPSSAVLYAWLVGGGALIVLGASGIGFVRFLRRHVLHLPKRWIFRPWAGIKDERGRTYAYALRLAYQCPKCHNRKMRFQQTPSTWMDVFDSQGRPIRRNVTSWRATAHCTRDSNHDLEVDVSGNDFDEPLPR